MGQLSNSPWGLTVERERVLRSGIFPAELSRTRSALAKQLMSLLEEGVGEVLVGAPEQPATFLCLWPRMEDTYLSSVTELDFLVLLHWAPFQTPLLLLIAHDL